VKDVRDASTGKQVTKETYCIYRKPSDSAEQQIYFHQTLEKEGWSGFMIENEKLGIGLRLDYEKKNLPELINWIDQRPGHNVVEVGPSNCKCFGREAERKAGSLQFIEPGETKEYALNFTVLEGLGELKINEASLQKLLPKGCGF
jgi:hypothetical protein